MIPKPNTFHLMLLNRVGADELNRNKVELTSKLDGANQRKLDILNRF